MDLSSVFSEYFKGDKTGQLLIKFEGEQNLCKVYIENGNAVHIAIGSKSPDETITYIAGRKPVDAHFIKGVPPIKKARTPFNNRLRELADGGFAGHGNLDFNAKDSFERNSSHQQKGGEKNRAAFSFDASLDFDAKDSFENKEGSRQKNDDFPGININENITEG